MHNVFTNIDSEEGDSASVIAFKTAVRDPVVSWCCTSCTKYELKY